jgi:hypothetical protein
MKKILIIMLLFACFTVHVQAALTYGQTFYNTNRRYLHSASTNDPLYQFIGEIEGIMDGSGSAVVENILFTLETSNPTATEGRLYYNATSEAFIYRDSDSWETIAAESGTVSLDVAYNNGNAIDVDGSAVTLTVGNTDNNSALDVIQNDTTNNNIGMNITNTGSGDSLQFTSTGGKDIDGTSSSWSVTHLGVGSLLGVVVGGSDIVMENGGIINNTTNNEIEFIENSEEFSFAFNGNTLTLATDTGITTVDWGALTTASGMTTITGDAAAFTLGITADAGAEDLTITQAGAVDASLILTSAGTSTTDALIITSVTGSTKIDSADDLDIDTADDLTIDTAGGAITVTSVAGDITVDSSTKSVIIRGTEEAGDAIVIDADGTAGGIDIAFGTGDLAITGTGASADFTVDADLLSIDGTGTSNITVTGGAAEDFTIAVAGAADLSLILSSTGTAADALQITTSAGGIDITNGGASGENLDIDGVLSAVTINSDEATTDSIDISSSLGGITMTSTAVASVWTHTATGAADDLTISVAGAVDSSLILASSGTGEDALSILASGTSASANSILIDTADGGITLTADGSAKGDITIDAADDVSIVSLGKTTYNGAFYHSGIITETISANDTMDTAADVGTLIAVDTAAVVILLPAVATGLDYWIMNTGAAGTEIHVDTNGNDKILGGCGFTALDDGDRITNTGATATTGDYVRIRYGTAVGWYIVEMSGIWADGS